MANLELAATLGALKAERTRLQEESAKLDQAIAVLQGLSGTRAASNGRRKKRTLSAAARRKIAKAQKLRWAKVRQAKVAKD